MLFVILGLVVLIGLFLDLKFGHGKPGVIDTAWLVQALKNEKKR